MRWSRVLDIVFLLLMIWWIIYTPPGKEIRQRGLAWVTGREAIDPNKSYALTEADFQWKLRAMDGSVVDFFQSRGKVILMHFLSSSCELCLQKISLMQDLYDTYKFKVTFLLVSQDLEQDKIFDFMRANSYTIPVYSPVNPSISKLMETDKISWIFIAKDGSIDVEKLGTKTPEKNEVVKKLETLLSL